MLLNIPTLDISGGKWDYRYMKTATRGNEMTAEQKFEQYRQEVRKTFQSMSDQALQFQDLRVVGGIDREELDREINRRKGW